VSAATRVCIIGFGEVGQILAADLHVRGVHDVAAWDIQFVDAASGPSCAAAAAPLRVGADARDAIAGADVVLSAVTAAQAVDAARSAAAHLCRGAVFVDLNSVSPGAKQRAGEAIEAQGGDYIEAAIMAPIGPARSASPMLFGGPHAAAFLPRAHELGFVGARVFTDRIGDAAAAKMCRSVVVKGMEALLAESLLTARRYGVEHTVLDSLQDLFPAADWRARARYMIARSLIHGRRRAEEMNEVAQTVAEAGLSPWMSRASVERQTWASQFRAAAAHDELAPMLDALLAASRENVQC
jgi:3-hydroxyisobutyrate dehydrogenase-like beta-hydroxyacid dehydrogenase